MKRLMLDEDSGLGIKVEYQEGVHDLTQPHGSR